MSTKTNMASLYRQHKPLFIFLAVGIFLIELEIFAFAAMKTGRQSILEIRDTQGNLIHVSDGDNLSTFDRYYFENAFGPLENYRVNLVTRERPFPFRAWFAAAIGLPVGAILLFGFVIRAYMAIFYGDRKIRSGDDDIGAQTHQSLPESRLGQVLAQLSRFNIFIIGFLILTAAVAYWIVPNMLTYVGRTGLDTIVRYKWVVLTAVIVLVGTVLWVIYLRYLLAKKTIESRAEVEKYRLQLEMAPETAKPLELSYPLDTEIEEPLDAESDPDPSAQKSTRPI